MARRHQPPSQSWRTFLTTHGGQIVAAGFFVVPTVTYRLVFVLVLLAHSRRRVVHVAVTEYLTAVLRKYSGRRNLAISVNGAAADSLIVPSL
jgi:hypothetical protein